MEKSEIALQLTLKAMELGYIEKRSWTTFESQDQFQASTEYAAKQISEFYQAIYSQLGTL